MLCSFILGVSKLPCMVRGKERKEGRLIRRFGGKTITVEVLSNPLGIL